MFKFLIFIFALLAFHTNSHAGGLWVVGDGGQGVLCNNRTLRTLDSYELTEKDHGRIDLHLNTTNESEIQWASDDSFFANKELTRQRAIEALGPNHRLIKIFDYIHDLNNPFIYSNDILLPTLDAGLGGFVQSPCKLVQLAVQDPTNFQINYDHKLLMSMPSHERFILALHEAMHLWFRDSDNTNLRAAVGYLVADPSYRAKYKDLFVSLINSQN